MVENQETTFEQDHPWLEAETDLDEEIVFALDELRIV